VKKLKELPPGCRAGDNANAFQGGFRLWEDESPSPKTENRDRQETGGTALIAPLFFGYGGQDDGA
jgi:polyphosphate glucokinase